VTTAETTELYSGSRPARMYVIKWLACSSHLITKHAHLVDILSDAQIALLSSGEGNVSVHSMHTGLGAEHALDGLPCPCDI
jgi:hypothetical protein